MAEIEVKDEGGDSIRMIDHGEYRSSFFGRSLEYVADVHRKLPTLEFRDDDVLLVSYPKAGYSVPVADMVNSCQTEFVGKQCRLRSDSSSRSCLIWVYTVYQTCKKSFTGGEVGNWKEWFTVSQSEMMDDVIERGMNQSQLKMIYQID